MTSPSRVVELQVKQRLFECLNGLVSGVADVDPDRLHQAQLTLVNQTTCREKWGGGFIADSHICSHPAGSASCMVRAATTNHFILIQRIML